MSALDQRITYPSYINREEKLLFRMSQPLKGILLCVKNTLQLMEELPAMTERFLLAVPSVDQSQLEPTPECSICGLVYNPTEVNRSDTSGVRSLDLLLRLPCKHIICYGCLKSWLAKAGSCPICRHQLTGRTFIEDDTDPRTEANSRPIFETILNTGLRWLATFPTEDDTDENTFGAFCMWANRKETEEQRAAMSSLKFFSAFSTSVEDARFQQEVSQPWIAEFRRQRESERQRAHDYDDNNDNDNDNDDDDDNDNDDREEQYETDSEDERRYREEADAEDDRQRYEDEHNVSHRRAFTRSESESPDYCGRLSWWDTDDEGEAEMAAEGEKTETQFNGQEE